MKKVLLYTLAVVALVVALTAALYGYTYVQTPAHIRQPQFEHYHFRTQIVVNAQPVNFAEDKFQEALPGACTVEVAASPVHFHDKIDQMTHIHWKDMTGGEVLKYYGWNFIGGRDNSLGNRFDKGWLPPKTVPVLGELLPAVPAGANFYVYTGDKSSYQRKDWNEFLRSDLEDFFGQQSSIQPQANVFSRLYYYVFPQVSAHGAEVHATDVPKTEEELTRINNLLGNVVIFVQPSEPTPAEIQARFEKLVPLQDSTCGG